MKPYDRAKNMRVIARYMMSIAMILKRKRRYLRVNRRAESVNKVSRWTEGKSNSARTLQCVRAELHTYEWVKTDRLSRHSRERGNPGAGGRHWRTRRLRGSVESCRAGPKCDALDSRLRGNDGNVARRKRSRWPRSGHLDRDYVDLHAAGTLEMSYALACRSRSALTLSCEALTAAYCFCRVPTLSRPSR